MLPVIPSDKANHFCYGAALAFAGSFHSIEAGGLVCAAAAIGKEIYDKRSGKGTPDLLDAAATILGGLTVLVPLAYWVR